MARKTTTTETTTTTNPAMAALMARAQQIAAKTPHPKRTAAPRECACGCGGMTRGGTWLPGHDAKALSRMLAEIRAAKAAA
jgi:hypothetical protein